MELKNMEHNLKTIDRVNEQIQNGNYEVAKMLLSIDIAHSLAVIADELIYMLPENEKGIN